MPDREKVIEELEETAIMLRQAIDRGGEMSANGAYSCLSRVIDAFNLLKEQEAVSVDVCGQMFTVKYGHCPKCNEGLNSEVYPHWCGFCGQAVKWE